MEKENLNAMDEINKGACMGMDAIHFVREKVKDDKFKDELDREYDEYRSISERINKMYSKYSDKEPHETNFVNKAMTWYGIEMKTINDDSTSKIAELVLQGVNMGIIEGKKILNNKNINKEVSDIVSEYVSMQEESVEKLKKFL